MKKFLQLDSKCCQPTLSQDDNNICCLSIGWRLNFTYLVQNISICLNAQHESNLMISKLRILYGVSNLETYQVMILDRTIDQPNEMNPRFFQRLKLEKVAYLFNTLIVSIEMPVAGGDVGSKGELLREIETDVVKKLGFEGVEIEGYNVDVYHRFGDKNSLYSLYSSLLITDSVLEYNLCHYHLGLIAKNSAQLLEAQQIFKKLLSNQVSKSQIGQITLILNIIDSSSKDSTKLQYLSALSKANLDSYSQSNLFQYCDIFTSTILHHSDNSNFLLTTTILNIFNYFMSKIGCSAAPLYQEILLYIFSIFSNKTFIKNLRRECADNLEVLVSCAEQFLEAIRSCVGFLTNFHIKKLTKLLLSHIYKPALELLQPSMIKLLHTLIKECEGGVEVKYDEWIRFLYLLEGEEMTYGMDIAHDMFYNKKLDGLFSIYEEYKRNILKNIGEVNKVTFLDSLNKHFTEIICNEGINMILITHFVDVISLFSMAADEHQLLSHSNTLNQFLQPFKALIYRLIDSSCLNQSQFTKIWQSFTFFFSLLPEVEDSMNNIIIALLNKFAKDGINPKHIVYIPIIIEQFNGDNKYPQFWERLARSTATLIPNSLHPDKVYTLLTTIIQLYPKLLKTQTLPIIIQNLINPYSEYRQQCLKLIQQIKNSTQFDQQLILSILKHIIQPYKNKSKSKITLTSNYKKEKVEVETKKIHLIEKLLSNQGVSAPVAHYMSSVCTQIAMDILTFPEEMKLVMYYKYYYLRKILTFNQEPLHLSHFNILSLRYPPITFSFLVCVASSRNLIKQEEHKEIFYYILPLVNQPWKNIQQLSISLLIYFSRRELTESIKLADELIESQEVYKIMMALTILYQLSCRDFEDSSLNSFIILMQPSIERLRRMDSIKELELLITYTLGIVNKRFNLGLDVLEVRNQEDRELMLSTFDYQKRMDSIIKRDIDKPIENILKLDESFGIPKKVGEKQEIEVDEIEIVDKKMSKMEQKLEELEKQKEKEDRGKGKEKQKQKEKEKEKEMEMGSGSGEYQQMKEEERLGDRNDHYEYMEIRKPSPLEQNYEDIPLSEEIKQEEMYQSVHKTAPLKSDSHQKQHSHQKSPIQPNPIRKIPKPIKHLTPKSKPQDESHPPSTRHKPKQPKKNKHLDSPVIEIESKHSKFKINLAQLNKTWRENLNLISKKPKEPQKRAI